MTEIVSTKTVSFLGDSLMAAQDNEGTIWAGVSYICNGIGLSKSQKDTQIQNVQKDIVLKRGCLKFQAGVFDPNNATVALALDFVPLWLAKISITPTMESENPELAERLTEYQLKAKDVLAAAFLPKARSGRKTSTGLTEYQRESLRIKQENTNVRKAATLERLAAKCPVDTYKLVLQSKAAELVTGEMLIPLPKVERPTFTAEQVGKRIGCTGTMVGRLANASGLKTPEYGQEVWDKARHSSKQVPSWTYYEEAVPILQQKLDEHLEGKKGK